MIFLITKIMILQFSSILSELQNTIKIPKNLKTKNLHKVFIPGAGGSGNDDIIYRSYD